MINIAQWSSIKWNLNLFDFMTFIRITFINKLFKLKKKMKESFANASSLWWESYVIQGTAPKEQKEKYSTKERKGKMK